MEPHDLLLIGGLIAVLYFGVIRPLVRRKQRTSHPSAEVPRLLSQSEARTKAEYILVELEEIQRTVFAKLDSKIRILEQLLAETDKRVEEYKSLLRSQAGASINPQTPSTEAPATLENRNALSRLHEDIYTLAEQGMTAVDIAEETGMVRGEVELILRLKENPKS